MSAFRPFKKSQEPAYRSLAVKPFYLFVFFLLVISTIICNTSKNDPFSSKKVEWAFLEDQVLIVSTSPEVSEKEAPIYQRLRVIYGNDLLYENLETDFVSNFGVLPIVREVSGDRYEVLLGFQDLRNQKIIRLLAKENQVLQEDTLPMFGGGHQDLDKDGIPEFMGYLENYPMYCTDCDSVYYNPLLIYEMADDQFRLDTAAVRNWVLKHYGSFHGFQADTSVICRSIR